MFLNLVVIICYRIMISLIITTLSLLLGHQVSALSLTAEEYAHFPPMNHNDRYVQCVSQEGGAYCVAIATLIPDGKHELYDKMMNFSFSAPRHYDYSKIRYGYCVTRRCAKFMSGPSAMALEEALGACLNSTLQREYGLRARIERTVCYRYGDQRTFTWLDLAATTLFVSIIGLVVAGTFYDLFVTNKDTKGFLMCFSVPANWARLMDPWPKDPTTARLIGVNGIRFLTSALIIAIHAGIPLSLSASDIYTLEQTIEVPELQLIFNGNIVVHTFVFLSGLFLAYTTQIAAERGPITWASLPKAFLLRWLRLSPVYLVMILFTITLFKFVPYGPMWQELIGDEMEHCKRDWMPMVFSYNNYVYGSSCQVHHWTTQVDMQLHMLGLVVLALPRGARNAAVVLFVVAGMFANGLETYFRDLDGTLVFSGKHVFTMKKIFENPEFNYLHKRTHTALPSFFIGMAFGLFLNKWMKNSENTRNYKKYSWLFSLTPWLLLVLLLAQSYLLLAEGARPSMQVRLLFAVFPKALWSGTLAALIFGMVCQVDCIYRRVLEWPGWVPLARLTYCVYNVHMVVNWMMYATNTQLVHISPLHLVIMGTGFIIVSLFAALLMWLLLEAPCNNLVRKVFPEKKSVLEDKSVSNKAK